MCEALPLIENLYLLQQQLLFIFPSSQKWKVIYFFAGYQTILLFTQEKISFSVFGFRN